MAPAEPHPSEGALPLSTSVTHVARRWQAYGYACQYWEGLADTGQMRGERYPSRPTWRQLAEELNRRGLLGPQGPWREADLQALLSQLGMSAEQLEESGRQFCVLHVDATLREGRWPTPPPDREWLPLPPGTWCQQALSPPDRALLTCRHALDTASGWWPSVDDCPVWPGDPTGEIWDGELQHGSYRALPEHRRQLALASHEPYLDNAELTVATVSAGLEAIHRCEELRLPAIRSPRLQHHGVELNVTPAELQLLKRAGTLAPPTSLTPPTEREQAEAQRGANQYLGQLGRLNRELQRRGLCPVIPDTDNCWLLGPAELAVARELGLDLE